MKMSLNLSFLGSFTSSLGQICSFLDQILDEGIIGRSPPSLLGPGEEGMLSPHPIAMLLALLFHGYHGFEICVQ